MKVGIIGLGAMGIGVARCLLQKGHTVYGCDLHAPARKALTTAGGIAHLTPDLVAEHCEALLIFVVNAEQTTRVLFDAQGAAQSLRKNTVVIMCATVSPSYIVELSKKLHDIDVDLIEAPVSGGITGAAEGKLTLMTTGYDAAYEKCQPIFDAISTKVFRFGTQYGLASKIKIINQLLVGVHIAAAAESMALGLREGVAPELLYEVITHSAGNSWAFADRVPRIVTGEYSPAHTALDIFVKDLGLVVALAKETDFSLPLTSVAHQMFSQACAQGLGAEDDTAVIKIFPDIPLPGNLA